MTDFLRFEFEGTPAFNKGYKLDWARDVARVTEGFSLNLAKAAQKLVARWLSPEHKYNVGASGKTAENLKITKQSGGLIAAYAVAFGSDPAYYIAFGFKTSAPSVQKLRMWALQKGITIHESEVQYVRGYKRKSGTYVQGYARAVKGGKKSVDSGLYAIQNAMRQGGSMRKVGAGQRGPNWRKLPPQGQGRFDYPKEVVRRFTKSGGTATLMMDRVGMEIQQLILSRIFTGQKWTGEYGAESKANPFVGL